MSNSQNQKAVAAPELTREQLLAEVKRLEAIVAQPRVAGKISMKVSGKGACSVYGLQRWPVTLYAEQWIRLLAEAEAIKQFLSANKASFSVKTAAQ